MAIQKKVAQATGYFPVSLVIPCYNEAHRVETLLMGLEQFSKQWRGDYEIIVANDGSEDKTVEIIEASELYRSLSAQNKFKIVSLAKNSGKGFALQAGIKSASKEYVLTFDADLSTHPMEAAGFANNLKANRIVIASREHPASRITEKQSRKLTGRIFNFFVRTLTPLSQEDTQCGFKLYPNGVAKKLFGALRDGGWSHDVEILYRAKLSGYEIVEMPVTWETRDGSKINVVKDAFKMFFAVLGVAFSMRWEWFVVAPVQYLQARNPQLAGLQPVWRMVFFMWLATSLVGYSILSFDFGITGDEHVQKTYGELILKWYQTGGVDKSSLSYKNLFLYGGLFDTLTAAANYYIGGLDEYDMRHLVNSWFGWLTLVFAGLLAYRLLDWRAGTVTVILLSLSPQFLGQSMNNPKDIPFAFSYIFTIYYLFMMLRELPRPRKMTWRMIALGIALSINIRAGGLILFGMLGAFLLAEFLFKAEWRKQVLSFDRTTLRLIRNIALVSVAGYFGGMVFWPYALQDPFKNPFKALSELTNFLAATPRLLFRGEHIYSDKVPWDYIPVWIGITTPLVILIGASLFVFTFIFFRQRLAVRHSLLIVFVATFPWTYAVYKSSPLYDGMRHFLFLYPFLVVMAALFFASVASHLTKPSLRFALFATVFAGMIAPTYWIIKNHPHAYTYFNVTVGGINGAYGRYETDYWMNSARQATEWLRDESGLLEQTNGKKILVASNMIEPVKWYLRNDTGNVKFVYSNFRDRVDKDWDYAIYYSRFIHKGFIENGMFPNTNTIYKVMADTVPLAVVVARKSKFDFEGSQALKNNNASLAVSLLREAIREDTNNEAAWLSLGNAYISAQKPDSALMLLNRYVAIDPTSEYALFLRGYANALKGNLQQAVLDLNASLEINPGNAQAYELLGNVYRISGDQQTAQQYFQRAQQVQKMQQR